MLKKGDRVEFNIKGEIKYGVVYKGGQKLVVIEDGGEHQFQGHASLFKPSNHPLAKDEPSEMDRYSLRKYQEIEGQETRNFNAIILENGKPVLYVSNDGNGGCDDYRPYNYEKPDEMERFYASVRAWVTKFGYPDMYEAEGSWVEWWQHKRQYGVTGKAFIDYIGRKHIR
jgi:hypothetical protein